MWMPLSHPPHYFQEGNDVPTQWCLLAAVSVACAALVSGCALFGDFSIPKPGDPPRDSDVIEMIANSPGYSLAGLCGEGTQCDARSDQVAAKGWERRLRRLGLPCERDPRVTRASVGLRSTTPEGIPFTIVVLPWSNHPGSPAYQFRARLYWQNTTDSERGQNSLRALEETKALSR
jgi:hypothetical protein